jgi:hypothetical protein
MKKKEKYYPVNNQEDEDGYTLYPENAMNYEIVKKKQNVGPVAKTEQTRQAPATLLSRSFSNPASANQE